MNRKVIFPLFILLAASTLSAARTPLSPIDEWYMATNDKTTRLYVTEHGVGDTLVVLHGGWGGEHGYLIDAFKGLESQYHFVHYDQRGSLRSPAADSLITVANHIDDLEHLRSELGLKKMNLIGHSTGGFLAMAYLEKYPDHVGKLILLSPIQTKYPVSGEQETKLATECESAIRQFFQRKEIAETFKNEGLNKTELTDKERSYRQKIGYAAANIYHLDRWRDMKGGGIFFSQKANRAAKKTMPESWNFNELLANHPFPVTIIFGDHDIVDSFGKLHRFWFDDEANVDIKVLKNAGHNSWIDAPDLFQQYLQEALAR